MLKIFIKVATLLAIFLPATASSAYECPPDKTDACNLAMGEANRLLPLWGTDMLDLRLVGAVPQGTLVRFMYQKAVLMDELSLEPPGKYGRSPLMEEVAKLEAWSSALCEKQNYQRLSNAGVGFVYQFVTMDAFIPFLIYRPSCDLPPVSSFNNAENPSAAPLLNFRKELQQEGILWSNKSRLYVYSGENLGCYFSELGAVASPWGNKRRERESMWIADAKKKWGARVSVADDGEYQTYFHFDSLADCMTFRIEWAARRKG